jgi:hypothetical protein
MISRERKKLVKGAGSTAERSWSCSRLVLACGEYVILEQESLGGLIQEEDILGRCCKECQSY